MSEITKERLKYLTTRMSHRNETIEEIREVTHSLLKRLGFVPRIDPDSKLETLATVGKAPNHSVTVTLSPEELEAIRYLCVLAESAPKHRDLLCENNRKYTEALIICRNKEMEPHTRSRRISEIFMGKRATQLEKNRQTKLSANLYDSIIRQVEKGTEQGNGFIGKTIQECNLTPFDTSKVTPGQIIKNINGFEIDVSVTGRKSVAIKFDNSGPKSKTNKITAAEAVQNLFNHRTPKATERRLRRSKVKSPPSIP